MTVKSQRGHSIVLDDSPVAPKVTLSSTQGRTVVLDDTLPGKLSVQTPTCQITLAEPGIVSLQATVSISLSAPVITLNSAALALGGGAGTATIDGVPFKLHPHTLLPSGKTGPVA